MSLSTIASIAHQKGNPTPLYLHRDPKSEVDTPGGAGARDAPTTVEPSADGRIGPSAATISATSAPARSEERDPSNDVEPAATPASAAGEWS